mmetsp:Transcript_4706/g.11288  ORF Transcript_4706/g.11288 Transcript_4706/m.11288 type:complete len:212 (+) Transcript_4706:495-1130(+)
MWMNDCMSVTDPRERVSSPLLLSEDAMATAVLCPTSWLFLRRTIGLCPLLLPEDKSEEAQKTGSWSVNTSSMHQFTGTLPGRVLFRVLGSKKASLRMFLCVHPSNAQSRRSRVTVARDWLTPSMNRATTIWFGARSRKTSIPVEARTDSLPSAFSSTALSCDTIRVEMKGRGSAMTRQILEGARRALATRPWLVGVIPNPVSFIFVSNRRV